MTSLKPKPNIASLLVAALLLWSSAFGFAAPAQSPPVGAARLVALKATIDIANDGDAPLDPYFFRLTIPANDHAQQQLLRIDYPHGDKYTLRPHDNGVDHYMKFKWEIPPRSRLQRNITFHLRLTPFDRGRQALPQASGGGAKFLAPSEYIESDAEAVKALAQDIRNTTAAPTQQLLAAFRYPQTALRYRQIENKGALFALHNGFGDCTEYAAVFIAIARALGFPARLTSEFHFSAAGSFAAPNHHAAEVLLDGAWTPVDPNLALDPALGYGFGQGGARKVVLKRGDSWTWSDNAPRAAKGYRDRHVRTEVRWHIETAGP